MQAEPELVGPGRLRRDAESRGLRGTGNGGPGWGWLGAAAVRGDGAAGPCGG